MRRQAGGVEGAREGERVVVVEVRQYRRCAYLWRLGDCLSPWVQPRKAEMIEMNSAGSRVWGSLMLAQQYKASPGAV